MPQPFYCYVDESGQHTLGRVFVVSVVMVGQQRDDLLAACDLIEQRTGKNRVKWIKTAYPRRVAYVQQVLDNPLFCGCLNFAIFHQTQDYPGATARAIAKAIRARGDMDYKATVIIDGLTRSNEVTTARTLRGLGVKLRKLRGVKDESDALIRLADATCGLVTAAQDGQTAMRALFERAIKTGFLKDVSGE